MCFSGPPREGAGAPEADDGPEGGRPAQEPDAGAEGAAQAHPAGDEGARADVQGLHEDLSHQPQRSHEPHRGEGQAQEGERKAGTLAENPVLPYISIELNKFHKRDGIGCCWDQIYFLNFWTMNF